MMNHVIYLLDELKSNLIFIGIILSGLLFNIFSLYYMGKQQAIYDEYKIIYKNMPGKSNVVEKKKSIKIRQNCQIPGSLKA